MIILFYSLLLGKDTKKTGEKDEVYFNIFHRKYKYLGDLSQRCTIYSGTFK